MNRRDFISALSAAALLSQTDFTKKPVKSVEQNYLVAAHSNFSNTARYNQNSGNHQAEDISGSIVFKNLSSNHLESYDLPIWAHEISQNPIYLSVFAGAAKWTTSAILFDYKTKKIKTLFKTTDDYLFFGHSFFAQNGLSVYFSAYSQSKKKGVLFQYNTFTYELINLIDTGGQAPHDCFYSSSDEICIINSSSDKFEKSLVTFLNSENYQLTKKIYTPPASHGVMVSPQKLLISGGRKKTRPEIFTLDLKTERIQSINDQKNFPRDLTGEALSLQLLNETTALITLVDQHSVLIWNFESLEFEFIPYSEEVLGSAKLNEKIYVSHTSSTDEFNLNNLLHDKKKSSPKNFKFGNGRHIEIFKMAQS